MTMNIDDPQDNSGQSADRKNNGQDALADDSDNLENEGNGPIEPESIDEKDVTLASEPDQNLISAPSQIPLLNNIVFNTSLPLKPPRKKVNPSLGPGEAAPRPTDLFGGTPETAADGPLSAQYEAHDIDADRTKVKAQASRVVDSLVQEYSTEIVRRLKDELTTLLNDLDGDELDDNDLHDNDLHDNDLDENDLDGEQTDSDKE
jgi:hypothetical protein